MNELRDDQYDDDDELDSEEIDNIIESEKKE